MFSEKFHIGRNNLSGTLVLKRCLNVLVILFLLLFGTLSIAAEEIQKKNNFILILSSFDYEDEWGTGIAKSIRTEIEKKNSDALVNITYAGLIGKKTFLGGRLGMQAAFANGALTRTQMVPAILVLIGDEAWMYYRIMNLRGVWESTPVVLVGVNPDIMKDYSLFFSEKEISAEDFIPVQETFGTFNIKALVNENSETNTIDLIEQLFPERNKLYFIAGEKSYQDFYVFNRIRLYAKKKYPDKQVEWITHTSFNTDSIRTFLNIDKGNAVVLTNKHELSGEFRVPVFSARRGSLINNNTIGGYATSIESYGVHAASIILNIFENEDLVSDISFIKEPTLYLNKEALNSWNIKTAFEDNQKIIYKNVPPSFHIKYKRVLLISVLLFVFLTVLLILALRAQGYRNSLKNSMERYKKLFEEYQIAYENMPMGLVEFDKAGNVFKFNPIAEKFLECIAQDNIENFNIYKCNLLGAAFCERITNKESIDNIFSFGKQNFRIIIKYMEDHLLMILIDITEIQQAKKSKEEIYSIFNLAMKSSGLGVCEYNLLDGNGFATDAWYRNLGINKNDGFFESCTNILDEYKDKLYEFAKGVKEGKQDIFLETIRVRVKGEIHWLRYILQPLEYAPEKGRILIAGLVLNMDKQKRYEAELAEITMKAFESDRIKNAFIANMTSEIRPSLQRLIAYSTELTQTNDVGRKVELLEYIERSNKVLLKYIQDIIKLSQTVNLIPENS